MKTTTKEKFFIEHTEDEEENRVFDTAEEIATHLSGKDEEELGYINVYRLDNAVQMKVKISITLED